MNIIESAKLMKPLIIKSVSIADGNDATSIEHLYDMIIAIESGEVAGEKAHRWLGWIQGVVCCRGGATLEEMKEINK